MRHSYIGFALRSAVISFTAFCSLQVMAGPWVEVGDSQLRSDIQVLADAGIVRAAVTTWPLAWGDIVSDLGQVSQPLEDYEQAALRRVRREAQRQTRENALIPLARIAVAENPVQIRSFENTPREKAEVELGAEWTGGIFAAKVRGTWVDDPQDGDDWRLDNSYAAMALGNWVVAASTLDRWWGPGWQSSMILSNNARPIPALTLDRNLTKPFKSKWLSWLGYWDVSLQMGQLEKDRDVSDALFFGARVNFRPLKSLEIGLSRTAIWCGEGRPCDGKTFWNLLVGNDNRNQNVDPEDEPGNQLAGWDIRWSNKLLSQPFAVYTQWIGEDEGGGLPAKYTGQFGGETWGMVSGLGTYRMYLEWSDTMCNFALFKSSDNVVPDCAYNHPIYSSGYRYKSRSIAHSFDNDASIFTFGTILTDYNDNTWSLRLGYGNLNRKELMDEDNTVAQVKTRYREIELLHRRRTGFGDFKFGAGYDYREEARTEASQGATRLFVEWVYNVY